MAIDLPAPLKELVKGSRLKHFPQGQIILYEGDFLSDVFIVKSGIVKLYDIDESGNEKVLHIIKTPNLFPFAFFSGENVALRWYYSALTDCELYVLSSEDVQNTVYDNKDLAVCLVNEFSKDVHELLLRLSSLSKTKAYDKLLSTFKFLLNRFSTPQKDGWWQIYFPVNHQFLADITGITRESVTTTMKELQADNLIRTSKRQSVLELNKDKLNKFSLNRFR